MQQTKNITVIPPDPKYDTQIRIEHKTLNVAAYCRVSTRFEQQENSHEAIISKEQFYQVQEEMKKRSVNMKQNLGKKYSSAYPLSGFIICSRCNTTYNRVTWQNKSGKSFVWRCRERSRGYNLFDQNESNSDRQFNG